MARKQGYRWFRDWRPNQRQRSVLDAIAEGRTNAEIARLLGVTLDGAKWHVSELLDKTGLPTREALAAWWHTAKDGQQPRAFLAAWFPFHREATWATVLGGITLAIAAGLAWFYLGQSGGEQAPDTQSFADIDMGNDGPALPESTDDQQVWMELGSRQLALPALAADGSCPVSALSPLGQGQVLGPGPIHPVGVQNVLLGDFAASRDPDGWYSLKTLWLVTGDYDGLAVVRGGRIDGDGELRFQRGSDALAQPILRIERQSAAWGAGYGRDTRQYPSTTQITTPGCYAWQVDGERFTYHVVFSAQEPAAAVSDWTEAHYLSRTADTLLLAVESDPSFATVDLGHLVEAFDCGVDCLVDVGTRLQPLIPGDELCIGHLEAQNGRQKGRLWVGRDACEGVD